MREQAQAVAIAQDCGATTDDPGLIGVAMDGKTVRNTVAPGADEGSEVTLFSAMLHSEAIVIAQPRIPDSTNEITQVAALLAGIDLTGVVVTGDAAHAQHINAAYLSTRELPMAAVGRDRLPEVPLLAPSAGLVAEFLRRWYGPDFQSGLTIIAGVDSIYYGLALLRSRLVHGALICARAAAEAAVEGRLPGSPDLRLVSLVDDYEPPLQLLAGIFARKGERQLYDGTHLLNCSGMPSPPTLNTGPRDNQHRQAGAGGNGCFAQHSTQPAGVTALAHLASHLQSAVQPNRVDRAPLVERCRTAGRQNQIGQRLIVPVCSGRCRNGNPRP